MHTVILSIHFPSATSRGNNHIHRSASEPGFLCEVINWEKDKCLFAGHHRTYLVFGCCEHVQAVRGKEEEQGEAGDEASTQEPQEDSSDDNQEEESEGGEQSPAEDDPSDDGEPLESLDDASDASETRLQCEHDDDGSSGDDEAVNQEGDAKVRDDDDSSAETLVLGQVPANNDDDDGVSEHDTESDSPDVENLCTPEKPEFPWREELFQSPMMGRAPAPQEELQDMCVGLLEHFGEFYPEIAAILILNSCGFANVVMLFSCFGIVL